MQSYLWGTAGQPIYCQGCVAKQGAKGNESPAGMWKGLDSNSLIITWPGYQCWCHATHMYLKIIDNRSTEDFIGQKKLPAVAQVSRCWAESCRSDKEWGFTLDLCWSWGSSALQEQWFRNYLRKHTPYYITLLGSLHIHVWHFQKWGHLGDMNRCEHTVVLL